MARLRTTIGLALVLAAGCEEKELDASSGALGESCEPSATAEEMSSCAVGLECEAVDGGDGFACAGRLEIRGTVYDALDLGSVEGATVVAFDASGAPVTDVAVTGAQGDFVLNVRAARDPDGAVAEALQWTLFATAADYQPFPAGIRPAIPINAVDADSVSSDGEDEAGVTLQVIDNLSTEVALLPLGTNDRGGAVVHGVVGGSSAAGTMVVAERGDAATYTIADLAGAYTLFNVPAGEVTVRGYRESLELEPTTVQTAAGEELAGINLNVVSDITSEMALVDGSVNIVNAPGGSATSVVLVPEALYNAEQERGPVPFGLRSPGPGAAPDVQSAFSIAGVPAGDYMVLVAFENDRLVRDPDESIAGTAIQRISVTPGANVTVDESSKVTEALAIVEPGAETPQIVGESPVLRWADDSSENRYEVVVFDALGTVVWEDLDVPGVSGGDDVSLEYAGPALTEGMYYQFRVTSFRETPQGSTAISRTEDLRGVFVFETRNGSVSSN